VAGNSQRDGEFLRLLGLEEGREGGVLLEVRLERSEPLLGPLLERAIREIVSNQLEAIHPTIIARQGRENMGRTA
jgi:hypothetical protein